MLFSKDPDLDSLNNIVLLIPPMVSEALWNLKKNIDIPWIRPLPDRYPRNSPDEFFACILFLCIICMLIFSFKKTYAKKKLRLAQGQTTPREVCKSYVNFFLILLQNCALFCLLYPIFFNIFG